MDHNRRRSQSTCSRRTDATAVSSFTQSSNLCSEAPCELLDDLNPSAHHPHRLHIHHPLSQSYKTLAGMAHRSSEYHIVSAPYNNALDKYEADTLGAQVVLGSGGVGKSCLTGMTITSQRQKFSQTDLPVQRNSCRMCGSSHMIPR